MHMNLKLIVVFSLPFILFLSGCGKDSSSPGSPPGLGTSLITEVDAKSTEKFAALLDTLAAQSLKYSESTRKVMPIDAERRLLACDAGVLAALQSATERSVELLLQWGSNEPNYRDGALEFYRKVRYVKETLGDSLSALKPYCEKEHAAVTSCLEGTEPVEIWLNRYVRDHMVVHPLLRPNSHSGIFIYALLDDRVHTTDQKNVFESMVQNTTKRELFTIANCLRAKHLKSAMGWHLAKTAGLAYNEASDGCRKYNDSGTYNSFCKD